MTKKTFFVLFLPVFIFFTACAGLLPSSKENIKSSWSNYQAIQSAYEKIKPGITTTEDLSKMGINPWEQPNIKILTFKDFIKTYFSNSSIEKSDLDEGIQKCLEAKNNCFGYEIQPASHDSKRIGNFFLDFFGFKKIKKETGWQFEGLILIVDNIVVYKERPGGKPSIHIEKTKKKPLGPLQDFGDLLVPLGKKSIKD